MRYLTMTVFAAIFFAFSVHKMVDNDDVRYISVFILACAVVSSYQLVKKK